MTPLAPALPGQVKVIHEMVVKLVAFADVPADQDSLFVMCKTMGLTDDEEVFAFEAPIVKTLDGGGEERFVLAPVLTPGKLDRQKEVVNDPEVIRRAAHRYMVESRLMDDRHNFAPLLGKGSPGVPVESYIAPQDLTFETPRGPRVVPAGSWMLGVKVVDDKVWADIKAGKVVGFSVWGGAKKSVHAERDITVKLEAVRKTTSEPDTGDENMVLTPEMQAYINEEMRKTVGAAVSAAVATAMAPIGESMKRIDETLKTVDTKAGSGAAALALVEEVKKTVGDLKTTIDGFGFEEVKKTVDGINKFLDEPVRRAVATVATPAPQTGSVVEAATRQAAKPAPAPAAK